VLHELDAQSLGPREHQPQVNQLLIAKPLLTAAADDRNITTVEAGTAIKASLAAATDYDDSVHTRQADELARGTSRNLLAQILRGAHQAALDLQDPKSDEAKNFIKEYKSGIYKKLGEWTVVSAAFGVVSAATITYYYGVPFFEFVAAQSNLFRAVLVDIFQNPQLTQIVDSVLALRAKLIGRTPD
jgi:hypothetical protein